MSGNDVQITVDVGASDDWDLFVYGPVGKLVAQGPQLATGADERATVHAPVKGTYEVRVQPWVVAPGAQYKAAATFVKATAASAPDADPEKDCLEAVPHAAAPVMTAQPDDGKNVFLDVALLADGVPVAAAAKVLEGAAASYAPFGVSLRAASVTAVSFPSDGKAHRRRAASDGRRPQSLMGQADCIGGVEHPMHAFAVGENRGDPAPFGPFVLDAAMPIKVLGHEVGHLMGAHHHYANCVEGTSGDDLAGDAAPCTPMFNAVNFQSRGFGTLEGAVIRAHACVLGLPGDLAEIDALLDDPRFFEPFRAFFHPRIGRPSIPMEVYLRMMFLKYRYRLGFEPLCAEVADSLAWRKFCRLPLGTRAPHPTTLMKITKRCGETAVTALNEALLAKAHEDKLVRLDRVRADTTVVEANVAYPTDSGLLAKGVAKLARLVGQVKDGGLATRTRFRDRTRSVRRRAHDIGAWLRRRNDDAKAEVLKLNGEMVRVAERTVVDARHVAVNARRGLRTATDRATGKTLALLAELERTAELVERVAAQTRKRLSGEIPDGATRIVSLHDPDARPIAKGRLGKPVEFGYKGQVVDNVDGIVVDHDLHRGNPPDAPMLAPAIARIKARFGRAPRVVTADRGYGEAAVDADLERLGVKRVVIPRKGRPGAARQAVQRTRSFRAHVKWRTGSEARISCLKRDYGWRRTLTDTETGARTWIGWGVLGHNATKIAALTREAERQRAGPATTRERPKTAAA